MKSILIIGLGRFGHHLCLNMARLGNDVMIVDKRKNVLRICFHMLPAQRSVTVPMKQS